MKLCLQRFYQNFKNQHIDTQLTFETKLCYTVDVRYFELARDQGFCSKERMFEITEVLKISQKLGKEQENQCFYTYKIIYCTT